MQYSLMIYQTPAQFAARSDPLLREANQEAFGKFVGALQTAGILVTVLGIEPPDGGATVRFDDGAARVRQGPYAATDEQLGGLCVIEVDDLDSAIEWAQRAPSEHCGPVEVRPTRVVPGN